MAAHIDEHMVMPKMIYIQRSRGYSLRDSLTIDKVEKVIKVIREVNKDVIRPSAEECVRNPRAKSTKMRWAIKA